MKTRLVAVAVLLLSLLTLFGCIPSSPAGSARTATPTPEPERPSLAAKLLVIDGGYPAPGPPEGHALLAPYEWLLSEAVRKTTTASELKVADCTVLATQMLAEEGVEQSCHEVLAGVVASVPEEAVGLLSYEEVVAAWVTVLTTQR